MKWIGKFRCDNEKCGHEWEEESGSAGCPKCESKEFTWTNYEELSNTFFSKTRRRSK